MGTPRNFNHVNRHSKFFAFYPKIYFKRAASDIPSILPYSHESIRHVTLKTIYKGLDDNISADVRETVILL